MPHTWIKKPFEEGKMRTTDTCSVCGAKRRRYRDRGAYIYVNKNGCRKLALAKIINDKLVFYALGCLLLFFISCGPSRNPQGEYWKTSQVWRRITAGRSKPVDHQLECPKQP